ncbi:MAG: Ada metal-binding domain-containing protein [Bacteroidia bacterium]|nr:Ada metal-binding domain-containing protein [Bacteroidia bacterium]
MTPQVALGPHRWAQLRAMVCYRRAHPNSVVGNARLRIYGRWNCPSGHRMKPENRVLFPSTTQALAAGYRPCKRCRP